MTKTSWRRHLPLAFLAVGLAVMATAWQTHPADTKSTKTDTVPHRNGKVRDIDEALEQLEQGKRQVEQSLRQTDWDKIQKDIEKSMKNFDGARIKAEAERAIQQVDLENMKINVDRELANIDMKKIQSELDRHLSQLDAQKMKEQIRLAIQSVDMDKIREQTHESLKNLDAEKLRMNIEKSDLEHLQEHLKNLKPDIDLAIADAQKGIAKAEQQLRLDKAFIDALDRDGLLDKKGYYSIQWSKGVLTVNGKEVPSKKYSEFLDERKDYFIKKEKDGFTINDDRLFSDGEEN